MEFLARRHFLKRKVSQENLMKTFLKVRYHKETCFVSQRNFHAIQKERERERVLRQESPARLCVQCGCYLSRTLVCQVYALSTDFLMYLVTFSWYTSSVLASSGVHFAVWNETKLSFFILLLLSPAISKGFTILEKIFAFCIVTFCLCGWCRLGVFLLSAFTRLGHECQDLLSPCEGMHVCTD